MEEVPYDEEEDVEDLLALGRAAGEEDDDESDDAEDGDGEVERVVVALPELLRKAKAKGEREASTPRAWSRGKDDTAGGGTHVAECDEPDADFGDHGRVDDDLEDVEGEGRAFGDEAEHDRRQSGVRVPC